jgi:maleate isomerase
MSVASPARHAPQRTPEPSMPVAGPGAAGTAATPAIHHGWRLRIGMLLPSVNSEAEPQIEAMLPAGVTLHTTRLRMGESSREELLSMVEKVEEGATLLAEAAVDCILFHCTAVTTYDPGMADRLRERIAKATGLPALVTADAVVAGLRAVGARKVIMLTPYAQDINDHEVAFLRHHGITVLRERGLGLRYAKDFRTIEPFAWYRMARELKDERAEACFISCAQARVGEIIATVERDLGVPVVTSNQAAAWHCLRQAGVSDQVAGFGTLLEQF